MSSRFGSPVLFQGLRIRPDGQWASSCVASEFEAEWRVGHPIVSRCSPPVAIEGSAYQRPVSVPASVEVASVSPRSVLAAAFENLRRTAQLSKYQRMRRRLASPEK
jgi:hypothetical protein